jgi:hypothetical protein
MEMAKAPSPLRSASALQMGLYPQCQPHSARLMDCGGKALARHRFGHFHARRTAYASRRGQSAVATSFCQRTPKFGMPLESGVS